MHRSRNNSTSRLRHKGPLPGLGPSDRQLVIWTHSQGRPRLPRRWWQPIEGFISRALPFEGIPLDFSSIFEAKEPMNRWSEFSMNELGVFFFVQGSVILRAICDMPDWVCRGISPIIPPHRRRRLVLLLCQDPPDGCHKPRRLSARPGRVCPFCRRQFPWKAVALVSCESLRENASKSIYHIQTAFHVLGFTTLLLFLLFEPLSAVKKRSSPRHQPVPKGDHHHHLSSTSSSWQVFRKSITWPPGVPSRKCSTIEPRDQLKRIRTGSPICLFLSVDFFPNKKKHTHTTTWVKNITKQRKKFDDPYPASTRENPARTADNHVTQSEFLCLCCVSSSCSFWDMSYCSFMPAHNCQSFFFFLFLFLCFILISVMLLGWIAGAGQVATPLGRRKAGSGYNRVG